MKASDVRRIAAGLIALLPSAGLAFEWSASLGLVFDRADTWQENSLPAHSTQPRLDVDLRLDMRGDIAGPGVLAWGGSAGYRRTSTEIDGARASLSNALTYQANLALFQHRKSPFTLVAFADRSDSRLDISLGAPVVGERLTQRYGGRARLVGALTPDIEVGYSRISFEEELDSVLTRTRTDDLVTTAVMHDVGAFSLSATFQGDWSDGTWVIDQFESQELNVRGNVRFGPTNEIVIVDRYFRRTPTAQIGPTFSAEANAFTAALWLGRTPGESIRLQFASQSTLTETTTALEESESNSLRYSQDIRLGAEYFARATGDLSLTAQRNATGELRSSGATLGPELWWRREVATGAKLRPGVMGKELYELSGGPLVSVLAVEGDSTRIGYGASARGQATLPWNHRSVSGLYEVRFGNDLFGQRGWSFQQSGSGNLSGAAGAGTYSAVASVSASRSWSPLLGDGVTRSISLLANYAWLRYTAFAQAALQNGVLPGSDGFKGDGLLIPVGFDTRQASVVFGATSRFSSLGARLDLRYTQSVAPGQPDIDGWEVTGGLTYRYGAFDVSLDDRFSTASGVTRNVIFFRLSRTIGSRY